MTSLGGVNYDVILRVSDTGRGTMTSYSGLATLGGVL